MLIFSPVIGLTSWQWIPTFQQVLNTIPYRNTYSTPNPWSWLILPGSTFQPTLNLVYLPSLVAFGLFRTLAGNRFQKEQTALLVSLATMAIYWFLTGWVPGVYPYVPRIMATYSSVENLAMISIIAIATLSSGLRSSVNISQRLSLRFITIPVPRPNLAAILTLLFLIFVIADAGIILPTVNPVDWGPLENQLNVGLTNQAGPTLNTYRVSLSNRILTRSLPFYQPDRMDTGGRLFPLNLNSFFYNWYTAEVFFKDDLGSLNSVYPEDRPVGDFGQLLESPSNFAGPSFWTNWYGANDVVFFPYYNLYNTIDNYTTRSSLYSVTETSTGLPYPEIFITPENASPILMATNATVVGFYSGASNASDEYNSMIALFSDLGLGPQYLVPLYLTSMEYVNSTPLRILVTDSDTYAQHTSEIDSFTGRGEDVIVMSSDSGDSYVTPTVEQKGNAVLVRFSNSLSQLVNLHETGAFEFVQSLPIVNSQTVTARLSAVVGAGKFDLSPTDWAFNYQTPNIQGSINASANVITLNLSNTNNTSPGQLNIEAQLPTPIPLMSGLELQLLTRASANVVIGESFASPVGCCPNYVGTLGQDVSTGGWASLHVPLSSFSKWGELNSTFGLAREVILAVNIPPGPSNVTVQFSNVTVTYPSYSNFTLQTPVQISSSSVLDLSGNGSAEIILSNESGDSSAAWSIQPGCWVTPLASFAGGSPGEQFDHILAIGDILSAPNITIFTQPPWEVVPSDWISDQVLDIPSVPEGFLGLVWKETYSTQWNIATTLNETTSLLKYNFAGPGMVYIPTVSPVRGITTISFGSITNRDLATYGVAAVTLVTFAVVRDRVIQFGSSKQRGFEMKMADAYVAESLDKESQPGEQRNRRLLHSPVWATKYGI
jgi:hypothetical protein